MLTMINLTWYLLPCCLSLLGFIPLLWRHNDRDGVSIHQPHDCLLNRLFRRRSKKTSTLCGTGYCVGNSPVTGEFPTEWASNVEYVSIWWRHHDISNLMHRFDGCPRHKRSRLFNSSHIAIVRWCENDSQGHGVSDLTHLSRDKIPAISADGILKRIFLMEMVEFRLKFHWNSAQESNWQWASIGSGNSPAPNRLT